MAADAKLPRLLRICQVAEMSGLHERTVRDWIDRGYLRAVKRGRWVRILTDDFLDFLERHRVRPRQDPLPFRSEPSGRQAEIAALRDLQRSLS